MFRARKAFAENTGLRWFVLSPKHGLLDPGEVIAPYYLAMAEQSASYRRAWGEFVAEQLTATIGPLTGVEFEVHAAAAFTEPLTGPLTTRGATVTTPLAGLNQGLTLAWYAAATDARPDRHDWFAPRSRPRR